MDSRINWIDMAKGYGIIFVMIGHLYIPAITPLIYTFHMPLFFFLSGYVFSTKSSIHIFIERKIKRLIIPYICLSIPLMIANIFFQDDGDFCSSNIMNEITSFIIQERHTTLWFIACLFMQNLLLYPIAKYASFRYQCILIFILCIVGVSLWRFSITALPWNFDVSLVAIPYFFIGYRMKTTHKDSIIATTKKPIITTCVIILCILGYGNYVYTGGRVDLFDSTYQIEPLVYLTAFIGIIVVLYISMKTDNHIIKYIGRNSLLFFAWHQAIVFPMITIIYKTLNIFQSNIFSERLYILNTLFRDFITILLAIIILYLCNEILSNSKLKFVIGK